MVDSARLIIEVRAGLIPDRPDPAFTRQWSVSSDQWRRALDNEASGADSLAPAPKGTEELLSTVVGAAQGYAALLMLSPNRVNWVRTDWVWL